MKQFLLIIIIILGCSIIALAQNNNDTISIQKSLSGRVYYIGKIKYTKGNICDILKSNPVSADLIHSYYEYNTTGYITLAGGLIFTIMATYEFVKPNYDPTNLNKGNDGLIFSSCAGVFYIATLLLFKSSNNYFLKAIMTYNKGLRTKPTGFEGEIKLNLAFNRLILSYSF